ncbi:MAG: hypothetical protein COA58_11900 [Bacteroidetes bacterium]|nr:MAG: hypothetical protein COA58_11900 [Bacteroidota bacterium]
MNLEEIKENWEEDNPTTAEIISLKDKKRVASPIQKISTNLIMEIIGYAISGILLATYMVLSEEREPISQTLFVILSFIGCINIALYLVRAIKVYLSIKKINLTDPNSLKKFCFNFNVSLEMYKAYNNTMMPVAIFLGASIGSHNLFDHFYADYISNGFTPQFLLIMLIVFLIVLAAAYFLTWLAAHWFYGKHIKSIEELTNDLYS